MRDWDDVVQGMGWTPIESLEQELVREAVCPGQNYQNSFLQKSNKKKQNKENSEQIF